MTNNPSTTPDRDASLSAFARQHPAWTVWRSLNERFYATLTARPIEKVVAETLPELSIEIRDHETYLGALDREERAYQARLANIARRRDSQEYDDAQAARGIPGHHPAHPRGAIRSVMTAIVQVYPDEATADAWRPWWASMLAKLPEGKGMRVTVRKVPGTRWWADTVERLADIVAERCMDVIDQAVSEGKLPG